MNRQGEQQSAQLVQLRGTGDIYWAEQFRQAFVKARVKEIVRAHRASEEQHIAAFLRAVNRHPRIEAWTRHLISAQEMIEEDYRRYLSADKLATSLPVNRL
jgi:hypothetical protein